MTRSMTFRVLIVDAHKKVRRALLTALTVEEDIRVVGEASSGAEALQLIELLNPDVVLMEIEFPDEEGADVIRLICQRYPLTRVVVLAMVSTPELRRKARQAGAIAYLQKYVATAVVTRAIRGQSAEPYLAASIDDE